MRWITKLCLFYRKRLYTKLVSRNLKNCGDGCFFAGFDRLIGSKYIEIANNTKIGRHATLTAWDKIRGIPYKPSIQIGARCNIGESCHITCINQITIGNNVLTGRWVTITDNSHGETTFNDMQLPPLQRKVYSKGPVVIEDNVWIGDKATILPGVTIGEGSVIAANAVVTKNVPSFSVFAGNPGKIVKYVKDE